jgi:putative Mn2+ efflux pump MntP
MLALLLVAASVGMSNFAAAISLGVSGVDTRTRLRVGLVFGAFESGMPVVGLLIGDHVASQLGHASQWIGGALLIGVGLYAILSSLRSDKLRSDKLRSDKPGGYAGGNVRLLISGLALSLDNLVVGFALGTYQIGILVGAVVIGAVSVALSLVGLELGARLGAWAGRRGLGRAGLSGTLRPSRPAGRAPARSRRR